MRTRTLPAKKTSLQPLGMGWDTYMGLDPGGGIQSDEEPKVLQAFCSLLLLVSIIHTALAGGCLGAV